MCGRAYFTYNAGELYFEFLNRKPLDGSDLSLKPSPTQLASTLRTVEGTADSTTYIFMKVTTE